MSAAAVTLTVGPAVLVALVITGAGARLVTTGAGARLLTTGTWMGPTLGCIATSAQPKNSSCGPQPMHAAPDVESTPQLLPVHNKHIVSEA